MAERQKLEGGFPLEGTFLTSISAKKSKFASERLKLGQKGNCFCNISYRKVIISVISSPVRPCLVDFLGDKATNVPNLRPVE